MQETKILNKQVTIYQNEEGFKLSQDALLLSYFAKSFIKENNTILDIGSGNGGITLSLAKRCENLLSNLSFTCIDIQQDQLDLLNKSIKANDFLKLHTNNFEVFKNDIMQPTHKIKLKSFDIAITNPPFFQGLPTKHDCKTIAHTQNIDLDKWTAACVKRLKSSGLFFTIIPTDKMDEVIKSLKENKLGDILIQPIFSKENDEFAKRVLIKAKKQSKSPAKIAAPIYLHKQNCIDSKHRTKKYTEIFETV